MQTHVASINNLTEESLPSVLMRIVSELHDVAYLIERIEPDLASVVADNMTDDTVKVMQGLDLAVQKTRGLADFIDVITSSIPTTWTIDTSTAVSLIKLAEMRKSLESGVRHGHSQPLSDAAGDCDLF